MSICLAVTCYGVWGMQEMNAGPEAICFYPAVICYGVWVVCDINAGPESMSTCPVVIC